MLRDSPPRRPQRFDHKPRPDNGRDRKKTGIASYYRHLEGQRQNEATGFFVRRRWSGWWNGAADRKEIGKLFPFLAQQGQVACGMLIGERPIGKDMNDAGPKHFPTVASRHRSCGILENLPELLRKRVAQPARPGHPCTGRKYRRHRCPVGRIASLDLARLFMAYSGPPWQPGIPSRNLRLFANTSALCSTRCGKRWMAPENSGKASGPDRAATRRDGPVAQGHRGSSRT